jgi:hypothetical protein
LKEFLLKEIEVKTKVVQLLWLKREGNLEQDSIVLVPKLGSSNSSLERCMHFPVGLRVIVKSFLSKPLSDATIHDAAKNYVTGFIEERHQVQVLHGLISQWDTSQVTDMSSLLFLITDVADPFSTFNEDFRAWDVSKVRFVRAICCVASIQSVSQ